MNEKIMNNYKLIYVIMDELHCDRKDEEEYFYYGLMGLYKGIRTYNEQKSKESTYYYTCIKNEILKRFMYNSTRVKEISLNAPINDEQTIESILVSNTNIEKELIEKEEKEEQMQMILEVLNEWKDTKWKTYLCMYYGIGCEPKTIKQIAEHFGIKNHAVYSSIAQGIEKIKKKIEEKYEKNNR